MHYCGGYAKILCGGSCTFVGFYPVMDEAAQTDPKWAERMSRIRHPHLFGGKGAGMGTATAPLEEPWQPQPIEQAMDDPERWIEVAKILIEVGAIKGIVVEQDADNEPVSQALIKEGFRVTCISSTGGFLRRGQSTLMIGVADEKVEGAIQVIRDSLSPTADPSIKRATLFVLNVEDFSQI